MSNDRRPRVQAVAGLRFLAALHVLAYHGAAIGVVDTAAMHPALGAIVRTGYTTTSMFLVLSGFMLYYAYVGRDGELRSSPRQLWSSRFATLYPIAVLAQLIALPMALFGDNRMPTGEIVARLAAAFTVTQAWIPTITFTLNGPAWTLSCLAVFYLLFPRIVRALRGVGTAPATLALVGCWVVSQTIAWSYLTLVPEARSVAGTDPTNPLAVVLHAWPPVRFTEFLSGVFLAHLILGRGVVPAVSARLAPALSPAVFVCLVGALVASYSSVPFVSLHNGLLLPLHWLLIGTLCAAPGALGRLLSLGPVARLGDTSLPLFLLHVPLLQYAYYAQRKGWVPSSSIATLAAMAAIIYGSHVMAVHFVQPLAKRLKPMLAGGARPTEPAKRPAPVADPGAPPDVIPLPVSAARPAAATPARMRAIGT